MGATLRFAIKPLVDALIQAGVLGPRNQPNEVELGRLSRRVLELEQEVARLKSPPLPAVTDERVGEGPGVVELHRLRT